MSESDNDGWMTVAQAVLWIAFGEKSMPDIWKRLDPLNAIMRAGVEPPPSKLQCAQNDSLAADQALEDLNAAARAGRVLVEGIPIDGCGMEHQAYHREIEASFFFSSKIEFDSTTLENMTRIGIVPNVARVRYSELRLRPESIISEWPLKTSVSAARVRDELLPWMLRRATSAMAANPAVKVTKEALIDECLSAFRCRNREAQEAYKLLPSDLRRGRGERVASK